MSDSPPSTDRYSDFNVLEQRLPPFSFKASFTVGWGALKRNYWPLVIAGVAWAGISGLASMLRGSFDDILWPTHSFVLFEGAQFPFSAGMLLEVASFLLVAPVLNAGFLYLGLCAVRWQAPGVGKLAAGLGSYWALVRANLLFCLFWGANWALALAGPAIGFQFTRDSGEPESGALIGLMVTGPPALVVMFYLRARLAYALLLITDPMSAVSSARAAVRASWSITRPISWSLTAVHFVLEVATGLSFLCLCLPGFLLGIPLACVVVPATYEMVRRGVVGEGAQE